MNLVPWRQKQRENGGRRGSALARWEPFEDFRGELDRLFDRFFTGEDWGLSTWGPALDMSEDDKSVTIQAEVPGFDPKEIEVSVSDQVLTISAQHEQESEKKERGYQRMERRSGSFHRSIQLPSYVHSDKADAEYRNGVLTIRLEKDERARAKRVPVKVAGS